MHCPLGLPAGHDPLVGCLALALPLQYAHAPHPLYVFLYLTFLPRVSKDHSSSKMSPSSWVLYPVKRPQADEFLLSPLTSPPLSPAHLESSLRECLGLLLAHEASCLYSLSI